MPTYKARQRSRRIDIEVASCRVCPYSVESFCEMHIDCKKTGKPICDNVDGELEAIGIHKDCPLELSYGQS